MSIYKSFPWIYTRTRRLQMLPQTGKLLDIGCGSGDVLRLIKEIRGGLEQHGTDIYHDKKLSNNVKFFISDLNKGIAAQDNEYAAAVSTHVWEHLNHPEKTIAEVFRILKPGGRLYLETPSHRSIWMPSFSSVNVKERVPINFYDDPTHLKPYSAHALTQLCETAGLRMLKTGYVRNWVCFLASPVFLLLAFIFRKRAFLVHSIWNLVGWSSYIVAEKPRK